MSSIASALAALESGDHERAKTLLVQAFDEAPGEASALLARIAINDGDFKRAEALSRTAIENFAPSGRITLADAVGRQGRRSEAEQLALDAISANADSGLLRAVLGEQRVRQAKWDLGTQDFIDALSLDGRDDVADHLWRVIADLTVGHQAGKVPTERALSFLDRVESGAPRVDDRLTETFATARRAIQNKTVMPQSGPERARTVTRPPQPPPSAAPRRSLEGPPPQLAESHGRPTMDHGAPSPPNRRGPDLISTLKRDRQLNESLQEGLQKLGLPSWPSDHKTKLDTLPAMVPKNLEIDRAEFQREHLNVTSGSVAAEIIIERALQSLMLATSDGTASAPLFDNVGLTQLEVALWDDSLDRMRPVPQVYLGETKKVDSRVLAIGAFLGACVVKPGVATWSFENDPARSTIETTQGDLEPFQFATRWVEADDKDDVVLEEFLGEARLLANLTSKFNARHDPTMGVQGTALSMKLAELWLAFRPHPHDTSQNEVMEAIRPLNVLENLIFFAIDMKFAPCIGATLRRRGGEVAIAYVRATGEFLVLSSRKHFARAVGLFCGQITPNNTALILDLFSNFHLPIAKVFRDASQKPVLERRGGANVLRWSAEVDGEVISYALVHQEGAAAAWQLLEV